MSQAGINSASAAGLVTSVTGTDGITAVPTTGNVVIETRGPGTGNMWLGQGAGVTSPSGSNNTGLGFDVLSALTTASNTTAVGSNALKVLTTGISNTCVGNATGTKITTGATNTACGRGALANLTTGSTNDCFGTSAGSVYTTSESNNICIGANTGVIGDNETIRIGTNQSSCFIQGIALASVSGAQVVVIDTTFGQLGSTLSPSVQRPIVSVSGTSKTFGLTDANSFQQCTNGSTVTLTVPTNASVAFPTGTEIDVWQQGAGQVVFAAAGGVTIQSVFSNLKIGNQYTGASLKYLGSDTWALTGNLTA